MIKSVQKAMKIMSALSDSYLLPLTLGEISQKTGIPKPTCSHIISTLAEDGYVEKISHSKGYILGPQSYCLTRFGKYESDFVSVCRPVMNYLYRCTGETVVLATLKNQTKFIIDFVDKDKKVFGENFNIRPDDIYRTATGRVMLSSVDRSDLKKIYDKYGAPGKDEWDGVSSFESLEKEVSKIKKSDILKVVHPTQNKNLISVGYASGLFCGNKCLGALGIALYLTENKLKDHSEKDGEIKRYLKKACLEINRRLRYEN